MYFYPGNATNFQDPVDQKTLLALESEVEAYELDTYLPVETIPLYLHHVIEDNLHILYTYDNRQHQHAYSILYQQMWEYIQNSGAVNLFSPPTGAFE